MAFVTSYVVLSKGLSRTRAVACYHNCRPNTDDPERTHSVHYTFREDEPFLHVDDIWQKYRWGKRADRLPICPQHRAHSDADWPKDDALAEAIEKRYPPKQ